MEKRQCTTVSRAYQLAFRKIKKLSPSPPRRPQHNVGSGGTGARTIDKRRTVIRYNRCFVRFPEIIVLEAIKTLAILPAGKSEIGLPRFSRL